MVGKGWIEDAKRSSLSFFSFEGTSLMVWHVEEAKKRSEERGASN